MKADEKGDHEFVVGAEVGVLVFHEAQREQGLAGARLGEGESGGREQRLRLGRGDHVVRDPIPRFSDFDRQSERRSVDRDRRHHLCSCVG